MKMSNLFNLEEGVVETILQQMGGTGRLTAMIGAYNFVKSGENSVFFMFPNPSRNKPNYVSIELNDMDLYDVTFARRVKYDLKGQKTFNDVPVENLKSLFEKQTELRLSL
jgi:hypothetical protein